MSLKCCKSLFVSFFTLFLAIPGAWAAPRDFTQLDSLEQRFLQDEQAYEAAVTNGTPDQTTLDNYRKFDANDVVTLATTVFGTASGDVNGESLARAQRYLTTYATFDPNLAAQAVQSQCYSGLAKAAFDGITQDLNDLVANHSPAFADIEPILLNMIMNWKSGTGLAASLYGGEVGIVEQQALAVLNTQATAWSHDLANHQADLDALVGRLSAQSSEATDTDISSFYQVALTQTNAIIASAPPPVVESGMSVTALFSDNTGFTISNSSATNPWTKNLTLAANATLTLTARTVDQFGNTIAAIPAPQLVFPNSSSNGGTEDTSVVSLSTDANGNNLITGVHAGSVHVDVVGTGGTGNSYVAHYLILGRDPVIPTSLRIHGYNADSGIVVNSLSNSPAQSVSMATGQRVRVQGEVRDQNGNLLTSGDPILSVTGYYDANGNFLNTGDPSLPDNIGSSIDLDPSSPGQIVARYPTWNFQVQVTAQMPNYNLNTTFNVRIQNPVEAPQAYLVSGGITEINVEVGQPFEVRWLASGSVYNAELVKFVSAKPGYDPSGSDFNNDYVCGSKTGSRYASAFGFFSGASTAFNSGVTDVVDYCGAGRTFVYQYRAFGIGGRSNNAQLIVHVNYPPRPTAQLSLRLRDGDERNEISVDPGTTLHLKWRATHALEGEMKRIADTDNSCGDRRGQEVRFDLYSGYDRDARRRGELDFPTRQCEAGSTFVILFRAKGYGGDATASVRVRVNTLYVPPVITLDRLQSGQVGSNYMASIPVRGGSAPYTWNVYGIVPPGLQVDSTGRGNNVAKISGVPTAAGIYSFTIQVTDASRNQVSLGYRLQIAPAPQPPVIAPLTIYVSQLSVHGQEGAPYSAALFASGGQPPYRWEARNLPQGSTLSERGVFVWRQPVVGRHSITVELRESNRNSRPIVQAIAFVIDPQPISAVNFRTTQLPDGEVGRNYSTPILISGGKGPYTWTMSGVAGLSISSSGVISGNPERAGVYTVKVVVQDSNPNGKTASASFNLKINRKRFDPVVIASTQLPDAKLNWGYPSIQLQASGGDGRYNWSGGSNPSFPKGLSLSGSGLISGTPTTAGSFRFSVTVTDGLGNNATASFTLNVLAPAAPELVFANQKLTGWKVGVAGRAQLSVSGGSGSYRFEPNDLYSGLVITADGTISGTPIQAGTFDNKVIVHDKNHPAVTKSATITIVILKNRP